MPTHVEAVWGTAVSIDLRGAVDHAASAAAIADVVAWLHRVDAMFSTYRDDSEISRLARGELGAASSAVEEVLERAERLRVETGGYFDVNASGCLDPSGVVKGWAVERASERLAGAGFRDHSINAGGDLRLSGMSSPGRRWRIAIAHPLVRDALTTVVETGAGAVATSGTAERGAHIIDPHTGRAALELASVTVTGADLTVADAYATAAVAMGLAAPEWLQSLPGYEAFVVDSGGMAWWTSGFPFAGQAPDGQAPHAANPALADRVPVRPPDS